MKVVKKTLGYIIGGVGLGLIAIGAIKEVANEAFKYIPLLKTIDPTYLMICGGVLVVVSLFFLKELITKKNFAKRDVPVTENGQVIAYKRE